MYVAFRTLATRGWVGLWAVWLCALCAVLVGPAVQAARGPGAAEGARELGSASEAVVWIGGRDEARPRAAGRGRLEAVGADRSCSAGEPASSAPELEPAAVAGGLTIRPCGLSLDDELGRTLVMFAPDAACSRLLEDLFATQRCEGDEELDCARLRSRGPAAPGPRGAGDELAPSGLLAAASARPAQGPVGRLTTPTGRGRFGPAAGFATALERPPRAAA